MAGAKRRKRIVLKGEQNKYYNAGNVAYDVQPEIEIEEERRIFTPRKPSVLERRRIIQERKAFFMHKVKLTCCFGMIFAGCIVTMASYANVAKQRDTLNGMKEQLIAMQADNNALQADIAKQVDLKYIEKEAKERLGMAEPQAYQIYYIDVPKQSYTVPHGTTAEETNNKKLELKDVLDFFQIGGKE